MPCSFNRRITILFAHEAKLREFGVPVDDLLVRYLSLASSLVLIVFFVCFFCLLIRMQRCHRRCSSRRGRAVSAFGSCCSCKHRIFVNDNNKVNKT